MSATASLGQGLSPTALRCEYLTDPVGIGTTRPRLSWVVQAGPQDRGQKQTAYQVLVGGDAAKLRGGNTGAADLWDSGRVASDETIAIEYAGKALRSNQACAWVVRVWDREGKASAWSEPATWSVGLLDAADWKGQWIGYDKPRTVEAPPSPLAGAKWIWHSADPAGEGKPAGTRVFTREFELPHDAVVERADLSATADNTFTFMINGEKVLEGNDWRVATAADVTKHLKGGTNRLRVEATNTAPGYAGLIAVLTVRMSGGRSVVVVTDGAWTSPPPDDGPVAPVAVVGAYGDAPWGRPGTKAIVLTPPPHLRTAFEVRKPVKRATAYGTALGIFDLYLNGKRITEDRFNPGWTDYTKRVYSRGYDVTALLTSGRNAFAGVLADGWYSGYVGYGGNRDHYGKKPRFLGQIVVEYTDGTSEVLGATGPGWKAGTGPTREADFLMGETYDARLGAGAAWSEIGFENSGDRVDVGSPEVSPVVQPHPGPPVRIYAELPAQKITEPQPGVYVLDLGQNFAGVVRLKVTGEPGRTIRLRYAERLNPDGTVYVTNLRGAKATDTYICRGGGVEVWEPRFTFHGFQYVEVTGLASPPGADTVVGLALSSDTPPAGEFSCSDETLNRLAKNVYWTQRSNFIEVPTDCPQRDERLGWTGDAQAFIGAGVLQCDVQAFFDKWLVDLADAQRSDGQFPMVAPLKVAGGDGGPAWADAGVICPWTIYQTYGDKRILERQYPSMVKFVEFSRARCTPDLLPPEKFHCFGDWVSIGPDTPHDVIFMAYFACSTKLTARAAHALGRTDDARKYDDLFEAIRTAFNRAYVAPDGKIKGDTQTAYILAIAYDLLDPAMTKRATEHLVRHIESRGGHLATGFVGTKDLMLALSKVGRDDVAYRLIHNDTFPSWGFTIKNGATSIWERWDGWTPEKGFQDPGMNSFAHYAFGAVYQWMVETIGGIRTDGPAYKHIVIAPVTGGTLTHASTTYRSIRGPIGTFWRRDGDRLRLSVLVPANTRATVRMPAPSVEAVSENDRPVAGAPGVSATVAADGFVSVEVGSGAYEFAAPWPR